MGDCLSTRRARRRERQQTKQIAEISLETLSPEYSVSTEDNVSTEYSAFKQCYDALVTTIRGQVGDVSTALFSKGLVSETVLNYVTTDGIEDSRKARRLVESVSDCIKVTPSRFHDFVAILEGPFNEDIVRMLRESYQKVEQLELNQPAQGNYQPLLNPLDQSSFTNETKPTKDIKVKPTKDIEVKPSEDIEVQPTKDIEVKPSEDIEVKPTKDIEVKPSEDIKVKPATCRGFVCPYCKECSAQQFYSKEGCPNKTQSIEIKNLFPYLDVTGVDNIGIIDLEERLISDTREIMTKFGEFSLSSRESLEEKDIPLDRIQDCVLSAVVVCKNQSGSGLDTKHKQEILAARSIASVFSILRVYNYISFLNYYIIELLVHRYGSTADKQKLDKYLQDFKTFCQRNVFEVPQSAFSPSKSRETAKVFCMKCTEDALSLEEVLVLKDKIAKIFDIESSALQLCSVKKGCIELGFVVSAAIFYHIFPLSSSQQSALGDLGVRLLPLEEPPRIDELESASAMEPSVESSIINEHNESISTLEVEHNTQSIAEIQKQRENLSPKWSQRVKWCHGSTNTPHHPVPHCEESDYRPLDAGYSSSAGEIENSINFADIDKNDHIQMTPLSQSYSHDD